MPYMMEKPIPTAPPTTCVSLETPSSFVAPWYSSSPTKIKTVRGKVRGTSPPVLTVDPACSPIRAKR